MRKCLFQHCTGSEAGLVVDLGLRTSLSGHIFFFFNSGSCVKNVRNTLMCRVNLFFLMMYKALVLI